MDEQQWQLDQWYLTNQNETQKKKQKKRKQILNPKITCNSTPKFEVAAVVKLEYNSKMNMEMVLMKNTLREKFANVILVG